MRLEDALLKENDIKRRLEIQIRDAALALRADKVNWGGHHLRRFQWSKDSCQTFTSWFSNEKSDWQ